MKKLVLFIFLLAISLAGAGFSSAANVKLHIVNEDGSKFLANEGGKIIYSLDPPFISVNFDRDTITVHPHVYYSPGAPYYLSFYDGFNVACGGHPRTGIKDLFFYFGPDGGEFSVPPAPYEFCGVEAWVTDSDGVLFRTESNIIHYDKIPGRSR